MSNKMIIIIVAVVAVVLLSVVGAGFFIMLNKMSALIEPAEINQENSTENASEKEKQKETAEMTIGSIYALEAFIVNLSDEGGKRFLRVTMDLEYNDKELGDEIGKRLSQLRDSVLMILPDKKYEDINNAAGKTALRLEIMTALNSLLKTGKIVNIYFTEFVVQ